MTIHSPVVVEREESGAVSAYVPGLTVYAAADTHAKAHAPFEGSSGEHGDVRTFRVCCRLVRGFALGDTEALDVLQVWSQRCRPPWTHSELLDKVQRARRYGKEPLGGLLLPPPSS